MKKKYALFCVFGLILSLIFFFCSVSNVCKYFIENKQSDSVVNELIDGAVVFDSDNKSVNNNDSVCAPLKIDFKKLQKKNKDIIAWIYCEGTPINYPIVQGSNNEVYLHQLTNGSYNENGALFLDSKCKSDFSDLNSIIYGHNMHSNAMFGSLDRYKHQKYYDKHPDIWLLTPNGNYVIELFAGFVTSDDSISYNQTYSEDDFNSYIKSSIEKSTFNSEVDTDSIDKIITLSTCSYEYENARYVVLGKLKKIT